MVVRLFSLMHGHTCSNMSAPRSSGSQAEVRPGHASFAPGAKLGEGINENGHSTQRPVHATAVSEGAVKPESVATRADRACRVAGALALREGTHNMSLCEKSAGCERMKDGYSLVAALVLQRFARCPSGSQVTY